MKRHENLKNRERGNEANRWARSLGPWEWKRLSGTAAAFLLFTPASGFCPSPRSARLPLAHSFNKH